MYSMPKPKPNEDKNEYISRCVRAVIGEGKDKDEALGQCYGMWDSAKLEKAIDNLGKYINILERQELVNNYEDELNLVSGLYKDIYTGLSNKSKKLFKEVYARCRQDGNLIAKSFNVACRTLSREFKHTDGVIVLKSIENNIRMLVEKVNGQVIHKKNNR